MNRTVEAKKVKASIREDLAEWLKRKIHRCNKPIKLVRVYKVSPYKSISHRKATTTRAYIQVKGEKFSRRLAYVWGKWRQYEHGKFCDVF